MIKNKIGLVVAEFNRPITEKLEEGALKKLRERDVSPEKIHVVHVPGAYEIPLAAQAMLKQNYDAVVALGAVIRGETTHYEYVCNAVERGCTQLQLQFEKPVVFGVLTTENAEQAYARVGGCKGHKGEEAIEVALTMLNVIEEINNQKPL